jgi:hypothetical protein
MKAFGRPFSLSSYPPQCIALVKKVIRWRGRRGASTLGTDLVAADER